MEKTKQRIQSPDPKFKVRDWVRVVSTDNYGLVGRITDVEIEDDCVYYQISGSDGRHYLEKNLEPYTKSEENEIHHLHEILEPRVDVRLYRGSDRRYNQ